MTAKQLPEGLEGRSTIDIPTAARVLGISRNSAYAAAQAGSIPTLRIGARVLVPVAPLLRMLGIEEESSAAQAQTAA